MPLAAHVPSTCCRGPDVALCGLFCSSSSSALDALARRFTGDGKNTSTSCCTSAAVDFRHIQAPHFLRGESPRHAGRGPGASALAPLSLLLARFLVHCTGTLMALRNPLVCLVLNPRGRLRRLRPHRASSSRTRSDFGATSPTCSSTIRHPSAAALALAVLNASAKS